MSNSELKEFIENHIRNLPKMKPKKLAIIVKVDIPLYGDLWWEKSGKETSVGPFVKDEPAISSHPWNVGIKTILDDPVNKINPRIQGGFVIELKDPEKGMFSLRQPDDPIPKYKNPKNDIVDEDGNIRTDQEFWENWSQPLYAVVEFNPCTSCKTHCRKNDNPFINAYGPFVTKKDAEVAVDEFCWFHPVKHDVIPIYPRGGTKQ